MENDKSNLKSLWRNHYCKKVEEHRPPDLTPGFADIRRFFAFGNSYGYVINFHDMRLDYVFGETSNLLGLKHSDFTLENLLDRFTPEDYREVEQKEKLIADFRKFMLRKKRLGEYKTVHFLNVKNRKGGRKCMMHQSMPLSLNKDGTIRHVVGVHTDVSHLDIIKEDTVSFMHLQGGKSYEKVALDTQDFEEFTKNKVGVVDQLTTREKDICRLLSEGLKSNEIANFLNISVNTVNTHRRKMLAKTSCYNTSELVRKFLKDI